MLDTGSPTLAWRNSFSIADLSEYGIARPDGPRVGKGVKRADDTRDLNHFNGHHHEPVPKR